MYIYHIVVDISLYTHRYLLTESAKFHTSILLRFQRKSSYILKRKIIEVKWDTDFFCNPIIGVQYI